MAVLRSHQSCGSLDLTPMDVYHTVTSIIFSTCWTLGHLQFLATREWVVVLCASGISHNVHSSMRLSSVFFLALSQCLYFHLFCHSIICISKASLKVMKECNFFMRRKSELFTLLFCAHTCVWNLSYVCSCNCTHHSPVIPNGKFCIKKSIWAKCRSAQVLHQTTQPKSKTNSPSCHCALS